MKNLKKRIRQGDTLIGCWLNLGSSTTAEIVGLAGYDWALIDLEHGAGTEADVLHQLQALEHTPAAAIIRVESHERQRAHRVLDLGAEGIMFPRVSGPEDAQKAISTLRYQPDGARGAAMLVRAARFGREFEAYHAGAKDNLVGIVQVETEEVLESLDTIAAIDGVDVLFVGPLDLSIALGTFGQADHPRFREALDATAKAAKKAGIAAGVLLRSTEEFRKYHELGFRFIACGSDSGFVNNGAHKTLKELKRTGF